MSTHYKCSLCNGTQMQFIEKLITDEDGEDIKATSNAIEKFFEVCDK
jgi:phosphoribosylformylglycinamidine (FGAM) synthase-like amidotransferase family enzyme